MGQCSPTQRRKVLMHATAQRALETPGQGKKPVTEDHARTALWGDSPGGELQRDRGQEQGVKKGGPGAESEELGSSRREKGFKVDRLIAPGNSHTV